MVDIFENSCKEKIGWNIRIAELLQNVGAVEQAFPMFEVTPENGMEEREVRTSQIIMKM